MSCSARLSRRTLPVFAILGLSAAAPAPVIAHLEPIALHDGINTVPGLLPDGGTATVVDAWRGNGNAHGYRVLLFLSPVLQGHAGGVVAVEDPRTKRLDDEIIEFPFDGERNLSSVRLARGTVDAKPASLLLEATLDQSGNHPLADHATATVRVYRLDQSGDAVGRTPFTFHLISSSVIDGHWCNAQLALSRALGIPLPADYGGANRTDGCFGN